MRQTTPSPPAGEPAEENDPAQVVLPADLDHDEDVDLFVARERSVEVVWNDRGCIDGVLPTQTLLVYESPASEPYEGAGLADLHHNGVLEALAAPNGDVHTFARGIGDSTYDAPLTFVHAMGLSLGLLVELDSDGDGGVEATEAGANPCPPMKAQAGPWASRPTRTPTPTPTPMGRTPSLPAAGRRHATASSPR